MWSFPSALNRPYIHVVSALSQELVARAREDGSALPLQVGQVRQGGKLETVADVRRSSIGFFRPDSHRWLYDAMLSIGQEMNAQYFGFDLVAMDYIQYAEYVNDDGYDWHVDLVRGQALQRKLSICVQLSSSDDYDGGMVEVGAGRVTIEASRVQGDAIIFPSFTRHRVAPITRGLRRSIVAWYVGPPFR